MAVALRDNFFYDLPGCFFRGRVRLWWSPAFVFQLSPAVAGLRRTLVRHSLEQRRTRTFSSRWGRKFFAQQYY